MNGVNLNYNERSWAIDVISHINLYCSKNNLFIKKAGGERTLKVSNRKQLYPDVLLYGNEALGEVVQGWELKMPDTQITDIKFIENAKLKANKLGLNSFLLWNAREAVLYVKENNSFSIKKNWIESDIKNRNDVENNPNKWKSVLEDIIFYLSTTLSSINYKPIGLLELSSNLYVDSLKSFKGELSKTFEISSVKNVEFDIEITEWINENYTKEELKNINKYGVLAEISILSWVNRFLFSHYLKTFNSNADIINCLNLNSSIDDVIHIFEKITEKCDFMNVFLSNIGDKYISSQFLSHLLELNELLRDIRFDKIDSNYLHNVIDSALLHSRRKIVGQFSTPENLAYFLSAITIKDRTANIIDTCCGSGTISKAIYQIKRECEISPTDALNQVWASDKFSYPLQLCSIALSDPQALGSLLQVFKKDVFELLPNTEISFIDPFIEQTVTKRLPIMHSVVSNLPFVRFETANIPNKPELNKLKLSKKSDLYAYIIFYLSNLVEENGRIGVVISNSWLANEWGKQFKEELLRHFKVLRIICSSKGKWFDNADVVATLLVLEKSDPNTKYGIDFITTNTLIKDWNKSILTEMITATISPKTQSSHISKSTYSTDEIHRLQKLGISWNALFSDLGWVTQVSDKLTNVNNYIDIARGERRGWDKMFYPENTHKIESCYIKPVLLSSKDLPDYLIGEANKEAFCCSEPLEVLRSENHTGALEWISKFEKVTNGNGIPLPEVLNLKNHFWYEMKPNSLADMVVSMNPDKKLCVYRLKERSFVNQRLIRLTVKDTKQLDILHALLNSCISLFYIESIGFGRGLGALDLNTTTMAKNLKILDPKLLSTEQASKIIAKFKSLLNRRIVNLPDELLLKDRLDFDKEILKAFNINLCPTIIYQSLLRIYNIRKSVKD